MIEKWNNRNIPFTVVYSAAEVKKEFKNITDYYLSLEDGSLIA